MRLSLLSLLFPLALLTLTPSVLAAEEAPSGSEGDGKSENAAPAAPEIGYYTLEPDFVTNLASSNPNERLHYVRIKISLMLFDENDKPVVVGLNPVIRDAVLSVIASKDFTKIASADGREKLRQECRERIASIMQDKVGSDIVRDVLFLSYMFQ